MCNFIKKLIPGNEPERIEINLDDMDAGIAHQMPTAALAIAKQAVLKMSTVVDAAVDKARDFMNTRGGSCLLYTSRVQVQHDAGVLLIENFLVVSVA